MTFALDTNVISHLLRPSQNQDVVNRFLAETENNNYVIPPLCYYETLWYLLRKNAIAQLRIFDEIYKNASTKISMGEADFHKAAEIRARLEEAGTPIGNKDADVFIAAYCIVNGYTLVTQNTSDFSRIDGLKLANWKE
ncbi:MAG: PIN domain-containing protein [Oscillospiraceae bacterium]|jgi:tRNA(fMet)-specific endonuclease VapC|nr:PIN domain-containing protein [Oscillospiraceae bacterium]